MEISTKPEDRGATNTGVITTLSPLQTGIDDDRLLDYVNFLETASKKHWDSPEINLTARRNQIIKYLYGKQLIGKDLKKYESEFIDNVIYEFEGILKALATSKMPDLIVKAGGIGLTPEQKMTAELLTKFFEKYTDSEINRKQLGMMFKHLPAFFIAARKYYWDASKEKKGGIEEEVILPSNLLLDHTAIESDPNKMLYIGHYVEKTAKEWVIKFPDKKKQIIEHVAGANPQINYTENKNDVLLAQKVKVLELWYDWINEAEDSTEEAPKFEFMSGVCWKLSKTVMLGNSKNPNWDYEGHDAAFLNGQPVSPEVMEQATLGQQVPGLEIKKVFNNYFEFPHKPFIFMTFDQFMRSAIDETSRIEQIIPMQKSMDDVERQTDYMVKTNKGKHLWGSDSGVTKKDLKKMDMNNPNTDAVVKGDPNKTHKFIQPNMPPGEMFAHIINRRDRMFAKAGVHGATRGDITTSVATTNQISRDADFTKNDDLVNDTILHVATESVRARLHMIKLRYTEEHFKQMAGIEEGKYLYLRLTNDSIDDGMEVIVKASTTDKLRAERNAKEMASLGYSEPYFFMKDMGIPNAEDRCEALYLYSSNPALWVEKVVKGKDIQQLANQVTQGQPGAQPGAQPGVSASAAIPGQEMSKPSPQNADVVATQPQGAPQGVPQGLLGKAGQAISNMFKR